MLTYLKGLESTYYALKHNLNKNLIFSAFGYVGQALHERSEPVLKYRFQEKERVRSWHYRFPPTPIIPANVLDLFLMLSKLAVQAYLLGFYKMVFGLRSKASFLVFVFLYIFNKSLIHI